MCLLSVYSSSETDLPDYDYHNFDLEDNFNILKIAELHPEKEENNKKRSNYIENIANQINSYSEMYKIDKVLACGDLGSFNDVDTLLNSLNNELDIILIAGDDDKINAEKEDNNRQWSGWMEQINSLRPFNTENNYEIYDEGVRKNINGYTIEAAHHPNNNKRDDFLHDPDNRDNDVLEELFSIEHDSNKETAYEDNLISDKEYRPPQTSRTYDLREDSEEELEEARKLIRESHLNKPYFRDSSTDIMIYDHVHMPYPRLISHENISDKIILGLGARRDNHSINDEMPSSSLHIMSLGDELVHAMHFDANIDEIFEHTIFEQRQEGDFNMYYHEVPGEYSDIGYLPIQDRFNREDFREIARESSDIPAWNP